MEYRADAPRIPSVEDAVNRLQVQVKGVNIVLKAIPV